MKIRMGQLRSLFTEGTLARLLREDDGDTSAHALDESGASLDAQVDKYLGEYETGSKKVDGASADQMEALDWRDLVKGRLILEAGENEKDDAGGPDDEAPGADELTGQATDKLGTDVIDVEAFANDVVRLIDNYDSLLEIRSTLVRRAVVFLKKTYDDDVIKAFTDTLRDDHGIEAGKDKGELDAEKYPAPAAARASGNAEPGPGGGPP